MEATESTASNPGGRLGLAVVALALVLPTVITWLYFFVANSWPAQAQFAIFSVVKVIQFALPVVWVAAVERRGLTLRPTGSQGVEFGLTFGLIVAAAMMALYYGVLRSSAVMVDAGPVILAKVAGLRLNSLEKYAAVGLFYSLCHSALEEYYWRWFVFGQLRRWVSTKSAIVVSALGFMAHHVLVLGFYFGFSSPTTYLLSACIAVGGGVWAWLYDRSGSLLGPWLSHMVVDAAIFLVGFDLVRVLFV